MYTCTTGMFSRTLYLIYTFEPLRTTYITVWHTKGGVYEVHSLQCTTVYLPTSQVACTQYAVYAFNYGVTSVHSVQHSITACTLCTTDCV